MPLVSFRVAGYGGTSRASDAQLFAQGRTLRISQLNGLSGTTGSSISPLHAGPVLVKRASIVMGFRELRH